VHGESVDERIEANHVLVDRSQDQSHPLGATFGVEEIQYTRHGLGGRVAALEAKAFCVRAGDGRSEPEVELERPSRPDPDRFEAPVHDSYLDVDSAHGMSAAGHAHCLAK
jgi:hypothetical protein